MNLWSQNLPDEFQNKEFQINALFIQPNASNYHSQEILRSIAEKVISSIAIKVFEKIADKTEYVYGVNFLSYVCLEVLSNDILFKSFSKMLNSNSFLDFIQILSNSIQTQGFTEDLSLIISERYRYYLSINPSITSDFIHPSSISTCDMDQINAFTLNLPPIFKEFYIDQYTEILTGIFSSLLSHNSKEEFKQFIEITKESGVIK